MKLILCYISRAVSGEFFFFFLKQSKAKKRKTCNKLVVPSCTHDLVPPPVRLYACLLDLLEILELPLCQQDDGASNSPVSSSAPTDAADGSRGGTLEAHEKQRKSSLGTNQNIIPPVPLIPECLLNDLLWTGAELSLFDLLSLALHPVSESGIDPDLNRS